MVEAAGVGLDAVFEMGRFCEFGLKSNRQKREIRSKGLVNPQITPSISLVNQVWQRRAIGESGYR
jgi:hypothetical protein